MGLSRLAALHGVATSYSPSADATVPVPDGTVVAVLAALGVDAATPEAVQEALAAAESAARSRLLPPTLVVWTGEPLPPALTALPPGTELTVRPEEAVRPEEPGPVRPARMRTPSRDTDPAVSGQAPGAVAVSGRAPGQPPGAVSGATAPGWWTEPPLGVHRLTARAPEQPAESCTLIVAPARVPQPPRGHGFLVQLYSLLSARSWGMGDLGDLADLASWSGRCLGASFVQVNPLHAAVVGSPTDPSPYR
ncbi:4-alpha-glucanotransferase, partial [Streptomyces sp. AC154]|uniref:4-alpha-glucanotransferase n=1 Tax=Streptomyces sp. AC154 TaxID=3143184 RepID=UPI003F7CE1E6